MPDTGDFIGALMIHMQPPLRKQHHLECFFLVAVLREIYNDKWKRTPAKHRLPSGHLTVRHGKSPK